MMGNEQKMQQATPETVWVMLRELTESQVETDRKMQETDRMMKETDRMMKDTDRRMKELQKTVGGWAYNHGSFAEEYFFNSFENGKQNFFGEQFDEIEKNLKNRRNGITEEYDIVLFNHTSVALIEVKYKAHRNDVPDVIKKAEHFRLLFPDYKDFRIYLGLASLSFYPELEAECIQQGIAVIKQAGDTVVINDTNLKVF